MSLGLLLTLLSLSVPAQSPEPALDPPVSTTASLQGQAIHPLSDSQRGALATIKEESERRMKPLALRLAAVVHQIDANLLADRTDDVLAVRLHKGFVGVIAQILDIKGESVRRSAAILTPDQKRDLRPEAQKPDAPSDLTELIERVYSIKK